MSDNRPESAAARQESDAERLDRLDRQLAEIRGRDQAKESGSRADDKFNQANMAWRMVVELVSGLGIGFAIGYGLDALLGTRPWLLVIFIFLGFAAGVKTMMATAREISLRADGQGGEEGQRAVRTAEDEGR